MEFFDKLSKKASETYKVTKEKTNKISGELKLKGKISDCKYKVEEAYQELGKMIYENRTNGNTSTEEQIQGVCDSITTLLKEIKNAENEILKLKDIKTCEKCSAEIDVKATFCPKCGAEQSKEEIVNVEIKTEPEDAEQAEVLEVVEPVKSENLEDTENIEVIDKNDSKEE